MFSLRLLAVASVLVCFSGCERPGFAEEAKPKTTLPDSPSEARNRLPNRVAPADIKLAHQALNRWRKYFGKQDAEWLHKSRSLEASYDAAWSAIDLDEAVSLHKSGAIRNSELFLMGQLALAGRIDEVVRFSKRFKQGDYHLHQFWARLAEYGFQQHNMHIIEVAGQGVEDNATSYESFSGGPPRPNRELLKARFFVAAARLELMRSQRKDYSGNDVANAAADLYRTARAIEPVTGGLRVSPVPNVSSLENYAILESWIGSPKRDPNVKRWDFSPGYSTNNDASLKPIRDLLTGVSVNWLLELPKVDSHPANAWIRRQIHQDRHLVALSYLAHAKGPSEHRARLLSVVAQGVKDKHPGVAKSCRDLAKTLIQSTTKTAENAWPILEARAQLILASHKAGNVTESKKSLSKLLSDFQSLVAESNRRTTALATEKAKATGKPVNLNPLSSIDYTMVQTLAVAVTEIGLQRADVPTELLQFTDRMRFHNVPIHRTPISVRGIKHVFDFSQIADPNSPLQAPREGEYFELVDGEEFPQAVEHVAKQAKLNAAWKTNCAEIGQKSAKSMGLKQTLEWTANIEDNEIRMAVEMHAILQAIEAGHRKFDRNRDPYKPSAVAAGLTWPSSGC